MYPTLFQIGSFKLASFGVVMVVAFLASLALARRRAAAHGFTAEQVSDISFWAILGGILGARLFFIVQDLPYYFKHLNELFSIQFQGLTSFGGFIIGGIVAWVCCRRRGLSTMKFLDIATPAFLVGHALGRIGCLLNGCCHGKPAQSAFPFAAYSAENHQYNVPAQLYDSLMNVVALFVLLWLEKKYPKVGFTLGMGMILHGLTRFIYEFFRAGSSSTTIGNLPFTEGHIMALVIMVVGAIFVFKPRPAPTEVPA